MTPEPKPTSLPEASTSPVERTLDPVLERIAVCESRGDMEAKNPYSSAKGKYQFLDSSWKAYGNQLWGTTTGKSVFSEKDQDDLAYYVVSKNGYRDWLASKSCWQ